jgi:hypothetical protein
VVAAPAPAPAAARVAAPSAEVTETAVRSFLKENPALWGDVVRAYLKENPALVEQVVWEVVPDLAETLIREEIARLLKEKAS